MSLKGLTQNLNIYFEEHIKTASHRKFPNSHHYYIHRRITTKRRKTGFSITVFLLHMAIFTLTLNANLFPFLLTIHFFVENFKSKIKQKI